MTEDAEIASPVTKRRPRCEAGPLFEPDRMISLLPGLGLGPVHVEDAASSVHEVEIFTSLLGPYTGEMFLLGYPELIFFGSDSLSRVVAKTRALKITGAWERVRKAHGRIPWVPTYVEDGPGRTLALFPVLPDRMSMTVSRGLYARYTGRVGPHQAFTAMAVPTDSKEEAAEQRMSSLVSIRPPARVVLVPSPELDSLKVDCKIDLEETGAELFLVRSQVLTRLEGWMQMANPTLLPWAVSQAGEEIYTTPEGLDTAVDVLLEALGPGALDDPIQCELRPPVIALERPHRDTVLIWPYIESMAHSPAGPQHLEVRLQQGESQ